MVHPILTCNSPVSNHGFVNPSYHLEYLHARIFSLYRSAGNVSHAMIYSSLYERLAFFIFICKSMHSIQESFRNICNWSDLTMESSHAASPVSPTMDDTDLKGMTVVTAPAGHMMAANDPDNPQNWPVQRKIYASAVAFAFSWVV